MTFHVIGRINMTALENTLYDVFSADEFDAAWSVAVNKIDDMINDMPGSILFDSSTGEIIADINETQEYDFDLDEIVSDAVQAAMGNC